MSAVTAPAREYAFELPIGLAAGDGVRTRDAAVRKMRGHEEALLHDRELGTAELVSELIGGTLLRLGSSATPGAQVARRMYSADRSYLLLQVRRVTLGDDMSASYTCPACAAEVRRVERLDEIEVRPLAEGEDPDAFAVALEDGWTDREGRTHTEVVLRLPTGEDEAAVSSLAERDPVKAADALVLRCVVRFGALPQKELEAYGLRILRDLSLGDRLRLQRAIGEDGPGARLRTSVRCDACGTRFERLLDVTDFFVPCWAEDTAYGRRSSTWPTTSTGPGARS